MLGRLPVEAAVVAAAAGSDGARDWLERGPPRAPGRSAATTCSPPACPARRSAAALRAARAALLDGAAPDRDAQLAAALRAERLDP